MSELTQIEREAKQVRDFINELKGLTPRFNATKERAEEELGLHLAKIDAERARLRELIDGAALIVQRLGLEEPVEAAPVAPVELITPVEEIPEPVVAVADSPQEEPTAADLILETLERQDAEAEAAQPDAWSAIEAAIADEALIAEVIAQAPVEEPQAASAWLEDQFEAIDAGEATEAELFDETPTEAEIAAAVEEIAGEPPAQPDATEDAELTDEQVERIEEKLAEEPNLSKGFFLNRIFQKEPA